MIKDIPLVTAFLSTWVGGSSSSVFGNGFKIVVRIGS